MPPLAVDSTSARHRLWHPVDARLFKNPDAAVHDTAVTPAQRPIPCRGCEIDRGTMVADCRVMTFALAYNRPVRRLALAALLPLLLLAGACDDDSPTDPTDPTITETFASAVQRNAATTRAFTTTTAGSLSLTLTSLGAGDDVQIGLGIGTGGLNGQPCTLTRSVTTRKGADPHLTADVGAGAHCVSVHDIGELDGVSSFVLTIVRPR